MNLDDFMKNQANRMKLVATGNFPDGKLYADDEGELVIALFYDKKKHLFYFNFGKSISWLAMPKEEAIKFANAILDKLDDKSRK